MNLVNGLHFNNIRGDIYGGLTAAVVALPLAMAMGVASGVGPIAGMYGAIFVGFFAALLGGTGTGVRPNWPNDSSVILHSYRCSQYISHGYQHFLHTHGIVGSCYDNAAGESFSGVLKTC